jgi:hypothetical protein
VPSIVQISIERSDQITNRSVQIDRPNIKNLVLKSCYISLTGKIDVFSLRGLSAYYTSIGLGTSRGAPHQNQHLERPPLLGLSLSGVHPTNKPPTRKGTPTELRQPRETFTLRNTDCATVLINVSIKTQLHIITGGRSNTQLTI